MSQLPALVVLALAYVLSHFFRSFLAVLAPILQRELGIGPAELSQASGAWFLAFAVSQIPVGILLDRYGPRLPTGAMFGILGGGGAFWLSQAGSAGSLTAAMVLLGVGCSPVLMASLFLFKRTFEPRRFAVLTSTFIGVGLFGNLLGSQPLAWAAETYGWRQVLLVLAASTITLGLLIQLVVRNPAASGSASTGLAGYWTLLKTPELWPIIPIALVSYAVSGGLRGSWAGPYLADVGGLDTAGIGAVTLWMAIAMTAGSFLYGPLDTLFGTRKWVAFAGNLAVLATLVTWIALPAPGALQATVSLVVIGLFGMTFAVVMAHATARIPDALTGRGVTLFNFFNIGGVGLAQFASGEVYSATALEGAPASGYDAALAVYAVALAVALVIYLFARDAPPSRKGVAGSD